MNINKTIRVCLVEDIELYADLLEEEVELTDDITFVRHYVSAIEALEGLPNDKPDVVLMDIDLKEEITGIECMFRVKDQIPKANFIMFTVFGDNDRLFDALKAGADGYVLKKDFKMVISSIREIMQGDSPMSKEIARKVTQSFRTQPGESLAELSPRELQVLEKIAQGYFNKEIGTLLNITEGGVKQHTYRIYKKLQVNNRVEATRKYRGE